MPVTTTLFAAFVFGSFVYFGVQLYFQQGGYALFGAVGTNELPQYLTRFEQLTVLPLGLPFLIAFLGNVGLLIVRPHALSPLWNIISVASLVVGTVVTLAVATPVYTRLKKGNGDAGATLGQLQRINVARLLLALVSAASAVAALVQVASF